MDPFRKHCLLNGLDDIGITLQKKNILTQYEQQRAQVATAHCALIVTVLSLSLCSHCHCAHCALIVTVLIVLSLSLCSPLSLCSLCSHSLCSLCSHCHCALIVTVSSLSLCSHCHCAPSLCSHSLCSHSLCSLTVPTAPVLSVHGMFR